MKASVPNLPKRVSLVAQTVNCLREGIRAGHWKERLPGERELCAKLQVGRRTLRGALEELQRQGWLEVADRKARRIRRETPAPGRSGEKKVVAVLSPRPMIELLPATMFVMDALRASLAEANCAVEFHVNRGCFSAKPSRALEELVNQHPADVWLIIGSKEPMQRWFLQRRLPCLVTGSFAWDIALPSVDVDYRAACHHAGGLLWRKGYRHVALVLHRDVYGGDVESEAGLRDALRSLAGTHLEVLRHDGTSAHVCALVDKALGSARSPTAFVVAGTMQVVTVMMHLARRGKRIPGDVAVICRDDDPFLQAAVPTVARYSTDRTAFARRLALAARQLAETGSLPAHAIRLMPKLLDGESLG
ncbi:MAG TPA: substrate-binding domain-containing protein [Prosthecobacter sp.]|nr:substrate-binding domain-containing protein [Prosthecobacter sp.]